MRDPNKHHNDGEKDRSEGKDYSPPHNPLEDVADLFNPFSGTGGFKERHDDNEAYQKGWENNEKQEEEKSGGCFLTTACVEHAGLPDNCYELTILRRFRDTHLLANPHTRLLVDEYYRKAPTLVSRISSSPTADSEFDEIYDRIRKVVGMIEDGRSEEAVNCYRRMFTEISDKYGQ